MGISRITVDHLQRFGATGKGASLGYPHFIDYTLPKRDRKRRSEFIFEELGLEFPDIFDIGELPPFKIRILDLNKPLPSGLIGKYDYVINPGTYEHVFNVGQALMNGWLMTRPGGLGFHHGSVQRPKLAYWNSTLNTWEAFCKANGKLVHYEHDGTVYHAVTQCGAGPPIWPQENNPR